MTNSTDTKEQNDTIVKMIISNQREFQKILDDTKKVLEAGVQYMKKLETHNQIHNKGNKNS